MHNYLQPSLCIDSNSEVVQNFAHETTIGLNDEIEKAQAIYYKVRDSILYDPYNLTLDANDYKASYILQRKRTFCIPKAVLLAAAARALKIPARLGFADVRNHLSSPKLLKMLRTDVFAFHGYTELFLAEKWVKATPAFNRHLCKMFGVKPLEFDGLHDSVFHEYSTDGRQHMEYLNQHGHFIDVPFDLLTHTMQKHYPHWFKEGEVFENVKDEPDVFTKSLQKAT